MSVIVLDAGNSVIKAKIARRERERLLSHMRSNRLQKRNTPVSFQDPENRLHCMIMSVSMGNLM